MAAQVDFLGVLFIVWGWLTALVGVSTLALGVAAVALIASASRGGAGQVAAGVTAAGFTALALIAVLGGAAHASVGGPLRRKKPWSLLGALMLGSVDLLLLPFGT